MSRKPRSNESFPSQQFAFNESSRISRISRLRVRYHEYAIHLEDIYDRFMDRMNKSLFGKLISLQGRKKTDKALEAANENRPPRPKRERIRKNEFLVDADDEESDLEPGEIRQDNFKYNARKPKHFKSNRSSRSSRRRQCFRENQGTIKRPRKRRSSLTRKNSSKHLSKSSAGSGDGRASKNLEDTEIKDIPKQEEETPPAPPPLSKKELKKKKKEEKKQNKLLKKQQKATKVRPPSPVADDKDENKPEVESAANTEDNPEENVEEAPQEYNFLTDPNNPYRKKSQKGLFGGLSKYAIKRSRPLNEMAPQQIKVGIAFGSNGGGIRRKRSGKDTLATLGAHVDYVGEKIGNFSRSVIESGKELYFSNSSNNPEGHQPQGNNYNFNYKYPDGQQPQGNSYNFNYKYPDGHQPHGNSYTLNYNYPYTQNYFSNRPNKTEPPLDITTRNQTLPPLHHKESNSDLKHFEALTASRPAPIYEPATTATIKYQRLLKFQPFIGDN